MKKWYYLPLRVAVFLLFSFSIVCELYSMLFTGAFPFLHIAAVFNLFAMFFALLYIFGGFRKSAARSFRLFLLFYAIADFCGTLYFGAIKGESPLLFLGIGGACVIFVLLVVLATGKDLGERVSAILSGAVAVISAGLFVMAFFVDAAAVKESVVQGIRLCVIAQTVTGVTLSVTTLVFVRMKYLDKKIRHTV